MENCDSFGREEGGGARNFRGLVNILLLSNDGDKDTFRTGTGTSFGLVAGFRPTGTRIGIKRLFRILV